MKAGHGGRAAIVSVNDELESILKGYIREETH